MKKKKGSAVRPRSNEPCLLVVHISFSIPTFISIGHSVRTRSGCMHMPEQKRYRQTSTLRAADWAIRSFLLSPSHLSPCLFTNTLEAEEGGRSGSESRGNGRENSTIVTRIVFYGSARAGGVMDWRSGETLCWLFMCVSRKQSTVKSEKAVSEDRFIPL